ncbi:glycoside hydrolase family 131 protein [Myriangium duriaei CBS 260.36]|uniref:Glycoside hydrolase family 131 protein n=1 Tax=Myriangium duriaei CBS 260.36 TaxID=1168546 RepID=A0A9P4MJ96_9PEZI|nr:glycoside hydrolase family 131 protein [Myriangium duriaei CBS 260.36]
MRFFLTIFAALVGFVTAGTVLWDGRFNDVSTCQQLGNWSFANPVGPYQYYIHGRGPVDQYVNLSPEFKNPADTSSFKGAKLTIDNSSHWWNQPKFETQLVPNTKAPINAGKVYYHFSLKTTATNRPDPTKEHHVCFFQNRFTQLLYGARAAPGDHGSNCNLRWAINDTVHWETELIADEWHNIAYEVDFSAKTVAFYHSLGANDLALIAGPQPAPTYSNAWDFHIGVLRLANPDLSMTGATEDWYFSGIYIETGPLTHSVSGPNKLTPYPPNGTYTQSPEPTATAFDSSTTTLSVYPDSSRTDFTPSTIATKNSAVSLAALASTTTLAAYSAAGVAVSTLATINSALAARNIQEKWASTTTLAVYSANRPAFTPSTIATKNSAVDKVALDAAATPAPTTLLSVYSASGTGPSIESAATAASAQAEPCESDKPRRIHKGRPVHKEARPKGAMAMLKARVAEVMG